MSQTTTDKPNTPEPKGSNGFQISRRAFLGVAGAAAAVLAVVLALKRPKLAEPLETQNNTKAIADEEFIPTSCLNCPTRCAIEVRRVTTVTGETKVVKIRGNRNSDYSEGKCCSRSHVGLQVLYNPDRFQTPLRRVGDTKGRGINYDTDFEPIDWDTAIQEVANKLPSPEKLLILQGLNTTSNEDLIRQFALAYGTPNMFNEDGLETEEEAVQIANDTPYGLAAYVWSQDNVRARRVANRIRAGQVALNGASGDMQTPFGGFKMSGNGREYGEFGLRDFLEVKAVIGVDAA